MAAQINVTDRRVRMDLYLIMGLGLGGARPPQLYDWRGHGPHGSYATGNTDQ